MEKGAMITAKTTARSIIDRHIAIPGHIGLMTLSLPDIQIQSEPSEGSSFLKTAFCESTGPTPSVVEFVSNLPTAMPVLQVVCSTSCRNCSCTDACPSDRASPSSANRWVG